MLISGPSVRREAYYYSNSKRIFIPTETATKDEIHEIEECNARHERARNAGIKEKKEAEKRLKELREEIGPEEFDRLMDGVRYKKR